MRMLMWCGGVIVASLLAHASPVPMPDGKFFIEAETANQDNNYANVTGVYVTGWLRVPAAPTTPNSFWVRFSIEDEDGTPIEELYDMQLWDDSTTPQAWNEATAPDWSKNLVMVTTGTNTKVNLPPGNWVVVCWLNAGIFTDVRVSAIGVTIYDDLKVTR